LLVLKFLRWWHEADERRIALLGHSGGSSTSNLVVRLTPWVSAQVTDYLVDFRNRCPSVATGVHCETIPALFEHAPTIHDPSTLSIPYLSVPYAFQGPELRGEIMTFFDRHLR